MPTMTMRLDETDAEVVRKYAEFEGKTISDFVRDAVFEKIEDQQDLATLREAVAADNGVRYTHEQVLAELGLSTVLPRRVQRHSPQATEENGPIRGATHYVMDRQKP